MPFTPFHLLLAAPAKAGAPRHFSVVVFGGVQVAMDIEPLIRSYLGHADLHGLTHNPFAACLIATACALVWRALEHWRRWRPMPRFMLWFSAFYGALSHLLFDAAYHLDPRMNWGRCAVEHWDAGCDTSMEFQMLAGLAIFATPVLWLSRLAFRLAARRWATLRARRALLQGQQSQQSG